MSDVMPPTAVENVQVAWDLVQAWWAPAAWIALSFQAQPLLRHELIKRLHARFNREGIEIPFPIRTVQIKGNVPGPA